MVIFLLKSGFLLSVLLAVLVFYSRIKENIGSGISKETFEYAKESALEAFYIAMTLFLIVSIGVYFFGK